MEIFSNFQLPVRLLLILLSFGFQHGLVVKAVEPVHQQLTNWEAQHPIPDRCTDLNGVPYPTLSATQTIGPNGPILLQDRFLLERIASFNRERIPERSVHAKGVAVHGIFTVTHDVSRWTKAKFLNKVGKQTPVFVRFSSTAGEMGFPDTIRDPKGFAVKFKTEDGNFDIAGNQLEVFNTRDPMLFVDVNRSRMRNPQTNIRDKTMAWDFAQLRPETIHHLLKSFSDIGQPESFRMINGSGVHTFKLVSSKDEPFFCKFHFISHQKFQFMPNDRATELAGGDPNYFQRDMYNAVKSGDFPRWTFAIQVATVQQAESYRWDYLDITKNWRLEDFPLHPVGLLELNRMPENFFVETEQAAFQPANLVPGVEPSEDRMLHARMFAYADAARYRLGVNYAMLPVNRPVNNVATYERDGQGCISNNGGGQPNYFPNSFNGPVADETAKQLPFFLSGNAGRIDTRDADNFSQAKLYLEKDIGPDERQRLAVTLGKSLSLVVSEEVREGAFRNVLNPLGGDFAQQVRAAMDHAIRNPKQQIQPRPYS